MAKLKIIELRTADVFQDMVRVHRKHRPNVPAGRICRLTCGDRSVLLVARGARQNQPTSAAIDLRTRNLLRLSSFDQEIEVSFAPANMIDELWWGCRASEPISRIATRLGVLAVVLGIVGAALGAIALFK